MNKGKQFLVNWYIYTQKKVREIRQSNEKDKKHLWYERTNDIETSSRILDDVTLGSWNKKKS